MIMRIKKCREKAGLQQKQVAEEMNVLTSAVSNWESEVALPRARQLPLLARTLKCTIDDLFEKGEQEWP